MTAPVTLALTTVGSEEDAARIARHLVETKVAACVSVVSPVRSFYAWKGELHDESEWLLLVKTIRPAEELRDALRAVHPYEVPELLAFPASFADEAYARWVAEETSVALTRPSRSPVRRTGHGGAQPISPQTQSSSPRFPSGTVTRDS